MASPVACAFCLEAITPCKINNDATVRVNNNGIGPNQLVPVYPSYDARVALFSLDSTTSAIALDNTE